MKILIKEQNKIRLSIWVPLFVLKSKILSKVLLRKIDKDEIKDEKIEKEMIKIGPILHKEIKKAIKIHGHINIVEIESKDGDAVVIKI